MLNTRFRRVGGAHAHHRETIKVGCFFMEIMVEDLAKKKEDQSDFFYLFFPGLMPRRSISDEGIRNESI